MNTSKVAAWIIVLGIVVTVVSLFLDPVAACGPAEYQGAPPGGFEIQRIDWSSSTVHYTPDGGPTECTAGFGYFTSQLGVAMVVLGVSGFAVSVGIDRLRSPP